MFYYEFNFVNLHLFAFMNDNVYFPLISINILFLYLHMTYSYTYKFIILYSSRKQKKITFFKLIACFCNRLNPIMQHSITNQRSQVLFKVYLFNERFFVITFQYNKEYTPFLQCVRICKYQQNVGKITGVQCIMCINILTGHCIYFGSSRQETVFKINREYLWFNVCSVCFSSV